MTDTFTLSPTEDDLQRRETEINGHKFIINHVPRYNFWEIQLVGEHSIALPKELSGRFTSSFEAYKVMSSYVAKKSAADKSTREEPKKKEVNGKRSTQESDGPGAPRA